MAWFHDYNRDYNRGVGYNRAGGTGRDWTGWRSSNYGYDRGFGTDQRWGSENRGYGRDYLGRNRGYGYDYQFRRQPEESPFYGRQADQGVQRWARRYGYDMQYEIQPRNTGGQGGYGGVGTGRGQGYGTTGRNRGWGQQGGYGRSTGAFNRGDRW